ncbi:MAG: DUF6785 family protein [Thermoproteota archaeon]
MSSESIEKIRAEGVPWILVISLTVILAFFGTVWQALLPASLVSANSLAAVACGMDLTSAGFIVLLIFAPLARLKALRERIDARTLTYIYMVGIVTSYYVSTHFPWLIPYSFWRSRFAFTEESLTYVPSILAPAPEVASQLIMGGVQIPFDQWLPSIIFFWALYGIMGLYMLSIATIFRRQYIDVENVPFPHAVASYEIVKNVVPSSELRQRKIFGMRPFFLGSIIGVVLQMPITFQAVFPWFPDIYGWRINTCPTGAQYVTTDSPLAGIVGLGAWNKQPLVFAVGYLLPLSILFNTWFWYFVLMALTQVLFYAGYYTGITDVGGCGRAWCHPSPLSDFPLKTHVVTYIGGLFGIVIFYLFLSRRYIAGTIRAALGRKGEEHEIERDEPIPYRMAYCILIGCFIILMILWTIAEVSILPALLLMISVTFFWFAGSRLFGLAGMQARADNHGMILFKAIWPVVPQPKTKDFVIPVIFSRTAGADTPEHGWGGALYGSFASYRIAKLAGVSNKNVFRALAVVLIITPLPAILAVLWFGYAIGISKSVQFNWGYGDGIVAHLTDPWYYDQQPASGSWIEYVAAGFIIVGIFSLMHARYVWFPFEPIGFILGFGNSSMLFGIWFPFLVAWILKYLTLRIGGSRAYEEIGLPLAGGVLAGCMAFIFIGGLMGVTRFFIPF